MLPGKPGEARIARAIRLMAAGAGGDLSPCRAGRLGSADGRPALSFSVAQRVIIRPKYSHAESICSLQKYATRFIRSTLVAVVCLRAADCLRAVAERRARPADCRVVAEP